MRKERRWKWYQPRGLPNAEILFFFTVQTPSYEKQKTTQRSLFLCLELPLPTVQTSQIASGFFTNLEGFKLHHWWKTWSCRHTAKPPIPVKYLCRQYKGCCVLWRWMNRLDLHITEGWFLLFFSVSGEDVQHRCFSKGYCVKIVTLSDIDAVF